MPIENRSDLNWTFADDLEEVKTLQDDFDFSVSSYLASKLNSFKTQDVLQQYNNVPNFHGVCIEWVDSLFYTYLCMVNTETDWNDYITCIKG